MKTFYVRILVLSLNLLLAFYFLIQSSTNYQLCYNVAISDIVYEFIASTRKEAEYRVNVNRIPYKITIDKTLSPIEKREFTIIKEKDVFKIKKSDNHNVHNSYERSIFFTQDFLSEIGLYPDVEILDSIFNYNLRGKNLYIETAAKFINNVTGETFYSNSDSSFYKKAFKTEEFTDGPKDQVAFQGFFTLNAWGLRYKLPNQFFYNLGAAILLLVLGCLLGYSTYRKWRKLKGMAPEDRVELLPGVFFNKEKQLLYNKHIVINLTKQMADVFELFANDPNRIAYYKNIVEKLWGKITDPTQRLSQLFKRIRKKIEPFEDIYIDNIVSVGYKLMLKEEEKVEDSEEDHPVE